ncbi:MAG: hypothetical protein IIC50_07490, partial [Planctomycetes bacterium]|nr:hypothetical protein [Planctomycetota bacterium]
MRGWSRRRSAVRTNRTSASTTSTATGRSTRWTAASCNRSSAPAKSREANARSAGPPWVWHRHLAGANTGWKPVPHIDSTAPVRIRMRFFDRTVLFEGAKKMKVQFANVSLFTASPERRTLMSTRSRSVRCWLIVSATVLALAGAATPLAADDGAIVAWGDNDDGQNDVPAPNSGFVAVAAGSVHSLGLKADGSIVAWGNNGRGQNDVPAPNNGFVAVAAGSSFS